MLYDGYGRMTQVITPSGATLLYYYNDAGNLFKVIYPDGSSRNYTYSEPAYAAAPGTYPGELTGVIDEKGVRFETTTFNDTNHAVSTEFAGGADKISLEYYNFYQNGGTPAAMTTPLGLQVTLGYADDGSATIKPSGSSAPCGNQCSQPWKSVTYDAKGYPATSTSFNGTVTKTTYDDNGLLTQMVEGVGTPLQRTTNTSWDIVHRKPLKRTVTDDSARSIVAWNAWGYNSRGQLTGECQHEFYESTAGDDYVCGSQANAAPGIRQIYYTYCDAVDSTQCPLVGLMLSADGPDTSGPDVYHYTYYMTTDESDCNFVGGTCHRMGDLATITAPLGLVTSIVSYDKDGRMTRTKDANGVITDLAYNRRGWLTSRTIRANADGASSAADAVTTLTYEKTGALQSVTDPDGVSLTFTYDDAHRLVDIADVKGDHIHYTLDASGNRTKEETFDAANVPRRSLSRTFNTLGQLVKVSDGLGKAIFDATATGSYDGNGNLIQAKDASGTVRRDSYDVLNRLVSTIANANGSDAATKATTMTFTFDALDDLKSVTDPDGLVTTFDLDGYRDPFRMGGPLGTAGPNGFSGEHYDVAGNMIDHTTAAGIETISYDALYRRGFVTGLNTVAGTTVQTEQEYTYDQPDTITGCKGSYPLGRLTRARDAKTGVDTYYCYDNQGRVTEQRRKQGAVTDTTDYVYSRAGRLMAVASPSGTVTDYGRDTLGQIVMVTVTPAQGTATSIVTTATYLPFGPISSYTLGNGQTVTRTYDANYAVTDVTSPALNLHFARDAAGNIVALGDAVGAVPATETYTYDPLYRLTSANDPNGNAIEAYTYSRAGDRLTKVAPGLATGLYGYQSGTHWLTSVGAAPRTFNTYGEITGISSAGVSWSYIYDARDHLTGVQQGGNTVASYVYDENARRVAKTVGSSTERFAYGSDGELLGEYGTLQRDYIWLGNLPVGVVDLGGGTASIGYVHADHLGAPRAVSNAAGTMLWSWPLKSNPFGEAAPVSSTGYVLNMRYPGQYFDAESGLVYNDHRYYDATTGRYIQPDPVGLMGGPSAYGYVNGNPMMYSDPQGLYAGIDDLIFTGGGALVGLVGQGVSDLLAGQLSSWQDYTGAAVGGAVGGEALLYTGPVGAGPAGGAATNISKQFLKNLTGKQCGYNLTSFAADTAVGGLTGFIPGARIAGVTAGRGSWNSIFRQMTTKLGNGSISNVSVQTALKMAGGQAVDTAVVPSMGAGAVSGNYLEPFIPGYAEACGCTN